MQSGLAFGNRNAPLVGGGLLEHQARGSAAFLHDTEEVADRVRTVRVLIAVFRVADGLLDLDALPIGFHLVGQDQGEHGPAAGSHFRAVRDDQHSPVGLNSHEHVGRKDGGFQCGEGAGRENPRAQHQGARSENLAEETAAAGVVDHVHAFSFAAR